MPSSRLSSDQAPQASKWASERKKERKKRQIEGKWKPSRAHLSLLVRLACAMLVVDLFTVPLPLFRFLYCAAVAVRCCGRSTGCCSRRASTEAHALFGAHQRLQPARSVWDVLRRRRHIDMQASRSSRSRDAVSSRHTLRGVAWAFRFFFFSLFLFMEFQPSRRWGSYTGFVRSDFV